MLTNVYIDSSGKEEMIRESSVWIRLMVKSKLIPEQRLELLREECDQLCKMIAKSLVTAKSNQLRPDKN